MGTPEFAVPSLERLILNQYQVVAVYTQPDRTAGRGRSLVSSPVKRAAVGWNLFLLVTYASASIDQGCGTLGDAVAFVAREGFVEAAHTIKGRFDAWYGFQAWRAPPPWR